MDEFNQCWKKFYVGKLKRGPTCLLDNATSCLSYDIYFPLPLAGKIGFSNRVGHVWGTWLTCISIIT